MLRFPLLLLSYLGFFHEVALGAITSQPPLLNPFAQSNEKGTLNAK